MNKKIIIFSTIVASILILSIFPNITSKLVNIEGDNEKSTISNNQIDKINKVEMNILRCSKDNDLKKTKASLSKLEKERLVQDLNYIAKSNISIIEKFEKELDKIKEYGLLDKDTKLEDIIDITQFGINKLDFKNVTNKNFMALFSPILIVGGGFGLGLGMNREKGLFNSFSHFIAGIGGLAYVLCVDFFEGVIYNLISFLMPILIGYIAGFTGIIIFSVEPGLFYSNLLMIGMAPFTMWIVYPQEEDL